MERSIIPPFPHRINDNESCADLLLERMDNVSVNSPDKAGR